MSDEQDFAAGIETALEIADPAGFLQGLSGLQGVRLRALRLEPERQEAVLALSGLNASFSGLPDEQRVQAGTLLLQGVRALSLAAGFRLGLRIARAEVSENGPPFRLDIAFDGDGDGEGTDGEDGEGLSAVFALLSFRPQTTWYAASIVIALHTSDDPQAPVRFYENVVLIEAEAAEAALAEARLLGAVEAAIDDGLAIDGMAVAPIFAGVRKLVSISNPADRDQDSEPPVSGAEITWSLFTARNQADFERYLAGEEVELTYDE